MRERTVKVRNALGLHARAAAKLVRLSGEFRSSIKISRADTGITANAKSILSILHIAAGCGSVLIITAEGDDEGEAIAAIVKLISEGFGELS
jgi:phosphocarrier protein HPr